MTTLESWALGGALPGVGRSATVAVLSADVESLTALKCSVEITSMKAIFESVIVILTIVMVRMLLLLPFLRSLVCDTVRAKYMKIRW